MAPGTIWRTRPHLARPDAATVVASVFTTEPTQHRFAVNPLSATVAPLEAEIKSPSEEAHYANLSLECTTSTAYIYADATIAMDQKP